MSAATADQLDPAAFWRLAHGIDNPLGAGERRWYPYEVRSEVLDAARRLPDPVGAYRQLLREEPDPYWRELLLFLAASSEDPRADDLLVEALDDPQLRPRALYLLGTEGTKGWPHRERDRERVLGAILPHIDDPTPYRDAVDGTVLEVGDLARAAFARVAGPERFPSLAALPGTEAQFVGLNLPELPPETRAALSAEIHAYAEGGAST